MRFERIHRILGLCVSGALMVQAQCLAECIALPCDSVSVARISAEPSNEMPCHGESSGHRSETQVPMSADHGGHGAHSDGEPCSSHVRWTAKAATGFQKTDVASQSISSHAAVLTPASDTFSIRAVTDEVAGARWTAPPSRTRTAVLLI